MFDGISNSGKGTNDALVICDLFIGVKRNVEVDLKDMVSCVQHISMRWLHTRISTRLSFKSTSVIASLLERDMMISKGGKQVIM